MAQYHVGCGLAGIYAGTLKKSGNEWRDKSDVTQEAIDAVVLHMYFQVPEGENTFGYGFKMHDGKYARLKLEVSDYRPEDFKEKQDETN